jgi:hypothetical protein
MDAPPPANLPVNLPGAKRARQPRPRRLRLSRNRQLIGDLLYFSSRVPRFPVEKVIRLAEVAELREQALVAGPDNSNGRISWAVLFLKAYALVAVDCPALRRAYLRWPWPHLGEMPNSVGMLTINRADPGSGEDRLCWGRFLQPERQSLVEMQNALHQYLTGDIEKTFRRQTELGWLPMPLRRLIWSMNLNTLGSKRSRRIGTFSISTLAGQGAWNRYHPSIHATSLTYGPLDERGEALVTLICDHRVLDGMLAAKVISHLEAALRGPIARELATIAHSRAAA